MFEMRSHWRSNLFVPSIRRTIVGITQEFLDYPSCSGPMVPEWPCKIFSNDRIFFRTRRLLAGSGNSPRLGLPTRASAPPAPRSSARISVKLFNSLVRWSSVSVSPGSGSSPFVPLVFCVRHCLGEISPILLTLLATSRVPRIGVCGT